MKKRKPASSAARPAKKMASGKPVAKKETQLGGDEVTESAAFRRATSEAEAYAGDPKRLRKLLEDAVGKLNVIPRGPFGEAWPYLLAMLRVARDFQTGDYRDMPRPKLLIVIAAIIYFVSPFDVIPDYLPVLGHIDDAFVIGLALKSVRAELDTFMAWETSRL
ncbi:MAG TPA: YkvA family protein [Chthoniobacterales bacterium]|nr:YkvA family protein [Chthoniobacterales bacterium]